MFLRSFIELLNLYNNVNKYASNRLANYSLLYQNSFDYNLCTVDNYLILTTIYKEFIIYYDHWFYNYFIKSI